jgi:hypothetical protein
MPDPNVWQHDYDRSYSIRIPLDIIDREIYVFHRAYDFVIVPMLEMIFYTFDNDMFVFDDDGTHYVEKYYEFFDCEYEHEEYNQLVYRIIEHMLHLNNERRD